MWIFVHIYDIAVIGAGPVGMFATFYAGLRSADVVLIEGTAQVGGQPTALYPQKKIYDIAGMPEISGQDLGVTLAQQMARFDPTIKLNTKVTSIEQADEYLDLTAGSEHIYARAVILATGAGAFAPRPLAAPYDHALDGKRVLYTITDLEQLRGAHVAIAGGGDSAIDWALALEPIAAHVDLIHRRDQFRGLESSVTALQQSHVELHTPKLIAELHQDGSQLDLDLRPVRGEEHEHLHADYLLVSYGFASDNKQLRAWHIDLEHNQVQVSREFATSRPHVYAIGDAVTYPGKLKLIASGFGEAPTAVDSIMKELYPQRRAPLHSSSMIQDHK
ncbi:thioredoxin reductase [Lacticaseibacillus sharpeae JCM 1186 = DSM 20505]|uniref:Ferredoxin--NADP reductase n=1 Tax=Lacticaseibacillus sharpeae JCM 1186 = DSM 20505 TaxID=1291052 RepID=A0A0R1ZHA3_9LACO|nr:thioredoxin reductase [Lacticaseibacillus sharpeae JCM 1186 = DSM 20505]